jgi:hypothetical protein
MAEQALLAAFQNSNLQDDMMGVENHESLN